MQRALLKSHTVLYAVALFGALCVVPAIGGADQISGDTADTLKIAAFANEDGFLLGFLF